MPADYALQFVSHSATRWHDERKAYTGTFAIGAGRSIGRPLRFAGAGKCARLQLFGFWLPKPRLCQGHVQCPLLEGAQGEAAGCPAEAQNGRRVQSLRKACQRKGRVGTLPVALQHSPPSSCQKRLHTSIGREMQPLRRRVPSRGLRLPPLGRGGQGREPERYDREPFDRGDRRGSIKVYSAMRELPSNRTRIGMK